MHKDESLGGNQKLNHPGGKLSRGETSTCMGRIIPGQIFEGVKRIGAETSRGQNNE